MLISHLARSRSFSVKVPQRSARELSQPRPSNVETAVFKPIGVAETFRVENDWIRKNPALCAKLPKSSPWAAVAVPSRGGQSSLFDKRRLSRLPTSVFTAGSGQKWRTGGQRRLWTGPAEGLDPAPADLKEANDIITPESAIAAASAVAAAITSQSGPGVPSGPVGVLSEAKQDQLVPDPDLIFKKVWSYLESKYKRENLAFPKEIIFLMGAPGSGKGTNSPYILAQRGIIAPPIVMSDLMTSPEMEAIKKKAGLIDDFVVVQMLLERLLEPVYQNGVLVDGFPRTPVQVEIIKLLHDQMKALRKEFYSTDIGYKFRRPIFRVTVLFVDEPLSIDRQLERGTKVQAHNEEVKRTGWGQLMQERPTDFLEEAARQRYAIFIKHYDTLKSLRQHFTFNIIPAGGEVLEVQKAIDKEFSYQSQLELGEETYDAIQKLPTANELTQHSRQKMIRRLDTYSTRNCDVFKLMVEVLNAEFFPIIAAHSLSGQAVVRSSHKIFNNPLAIPMVIDILSERGFYVVCDVKKSKVPVKYEWVGKGSEAKSLQAVFIEERIVIFHIRFKRPVIRND